MKSDMKVDISGGQYQVTTLNIKMYCEIPYFFIRYK